MRLTLVHCLSWNSLKVAAKDRERSAKGLKSLTTHVAAILRKLSGDPQLEFAQQLRGDMCVMLSSKVL